MIFAEKLVVLRKKEGFSQEELADKLDVSRQAVYKWETGQSKPDIEKLRVLSKLFDVSIDNLLNDKEDILHKSNETKKIQFGEVFVSDKSMEDIDVEGDNTKKLPDEEKKIKLRKWAKRLTYVGTFVLLFSGVFIAIENINLAATVFCLGILCFISFILIKIFLYKDVQYSSAYIEQKMEVEEKKLENLGYTHMRLQHDLAAWFFYDNEKNCFGFYFDGKEQFICPIQNYVNLSYMAYGDGVVQKNKLGASLIFGAVKGIGIHSKPTYSSSAGRLFSFSLTYFDENGQDKVYEYSLNATRIYAVDKYPNAYEGLFEGLAKAAINSCEKIKTKLDLEKSKLL